MSPENKDGIVHGMRPMPKGAVMYRGDTTLCGETVVGADSETPGTKITSNKEDISCPKCKADR